MPPKKVGPSIGNSIREEEKDFEDDALLWREPALQAAVEAELQRRGQHALLTIERARHSVLDAAHEKGEEIRPRRRAALYADPILRIVESQAFTDDQKVAALADLARQQRNAVGAVRAHNKQVKRIINNAEAKRRAARSSCAPKGPHTRKSPRDSPPPGPPRAGAAFRLVDLMA